MDIPERYMTASLKDFPSAVSEPLRKWAANPDPAMFTLTGPVGTGKTHALYAVARLCRDARIYDVPDMITRIQRAAVMDTDAWSWHEIHFMDNLIKHKKSVMLDDLGAEKTTDYVLQEIGRLISQREKWSRPTMITTNLGLDELAVKLGDRIASRLSGGKVLKLRGKDWRRT